MTISRIRGYVQDTPQRLLWLLWLPGSILVGLGMLGDRQGWWASWPSLLNGLSTVIGACFGAPIAVHVLQWLSRKQAEQLSKSQNWREIDQMVVQINRHIVDLKTRLLEADTIRRLTDAAQIIDHHLILPHFISPSVSLETLAAALDILIEGWADRQHDLSEACSTIRANWTVYRDAISARLSPEQNAANIRAWESFGHVINRLQVPYINPNSLVAYRDHLLAPAGKRYPHKDALHTSMRSFVSFLGAAANIQALPSPRITGQI